MRELLKWHQWGRKGVLMLGIFVVYAHSLKKKLLGAISEKEELEPPFAYPTRFPQALMSRSTHSQNTPSKEGSSKDFARKIQSSNQPSGGSQNMDLRTAQAVGKGDRSYRSRDRDERGSCCISKEMCLH